MMKPFQEPNLTMLTDFYEFTMANGYFRQRLSGIRSAILICFSAKCPTRAALPLWRVWNSWCDYLENICGFTEEDIELSARQKHIFSEEFLEYLRNFKFSCDVWAVPEGTPIFPRGAHRHCARPGHTGTVY